MSIAFRAGEERGYHIYFSFFSLFLQLKWAFGQSELTCSLSADVKCYVKLSNEGHKALSSHAVQIKHRQLVPEEVLGTSKGVAIFSRSGRSQMNCLTSASYKKLRQEMGFMVEGDICALVLQCRTLIGCPNSDTNDSDGKSIDPSAGFFAAFQKIPISTKNVYLL